MKSVQTVGVAAEGTNANTHGAMHQWPNRVRDAGSNVLVLTEQLDYAAMTDDRLHTAMLEARAGLYRRSIEAHVYLRDEVLPACKEIIARFKMPGVAAKYRLNEQPTVEEYFRSIGVSYDTVRSWIRREKDRILLLEGFAADKPKPLTRLERASHAVVQAHRTGGNVESAILDLEAAAPPRFEPHIEIETPAGEKLSKLALRLVREIESFFSSPSKPSMPKKLRAIADKLKSELEQRGGYNANQRKSRGTVKRNPRNA